MRNPISRWLRVAVCTLPVVLAAALVLPVSHGQDKVVPARAEVSPLDQPIAWMTEAKRNFTAVKDYQCWLVSQERVKGVLLEKNVIHFKMRSEPFSVAMYWKEPRKFEGQEVVFVAGKNNNKMRVKSTVIGNGGLLGWLSIDPNDPRVLQNSRHTILEAGLANMIDQNLKHWEQVRPLGQTKVTVGQYRYDNRDCIRLEITALQRAAASYCCRSVLYLEKESKIPIRMENYDWPRDGGTPGGDLLESFSYNSLQFNVGLKDAEFNK